MKLDNRGGIVLAMNTDDELLYDVADLFKSFSDSTRIRIMYSLFDKEMCVNDIANQLNMTVSAISHQIGRASCRERV